MVEGDANKSWRGPLLHRGREASPRRITRRDSSKGLVNRPEDTSFGQPGTPDAPLRGASPWGFFDAFTPN